MCIVYCGFASAGVSTIPTSMFIIRGRNASTIFWLDTPQLQPNHSRTNLDNVGCWKDIEGPTKRHPVFGSVFKHMTALQCVLAFVLVVVGLCLLVPRVVAGVVAATVLLLGVYVSAKIVELRGTCQLCHTHLRPSSSDSVRCCSTPTPVSRNRWRFVYARAASRSQAQTTRERLRERLSHCASRARRTAKAWQPQCTFWFEPY